MVAQQVRSSKVRNLILITVFVVTAAILIGLKWSTKGSGEAATKAKVPGAPSGMKFEPAAGNLSKEYLQSLIAEDQQKAASALKKGKSALPLVIKTDIQGADVGGVVDSKSLAPCVQQCLACCQGSVSTSDLLSQWTKQNKLSPAVAQEISRLQDQGLSEADYAKALDQLVRQGKLTPEQAKQLLAAYRREHASAGVSTSGDGVDPVDAMVAAGVLDTAVASSLKDLQKKQVPVEEYAAMLGRLVKEGKLTPEQSKQLLAAYRAQLAQSEAAASAAQAKTAISDVGSDAALQALVQSGELSPAVAQTLQSLGKAGLSAADYAAELNALVKAGKLSPALAQKLLEAYREKHGDSRSVSSDPALARMEKAQQANALRAQESLLMAQRQQIEQRQRAQQQQLQQKQQQDLEGQMGVQMQAILAAWNPTPQVFVMSKAETASAGGTGTAANGTVSGTAFESAAPIIKAGTILFGVLDTGVQSDEPGPVMATIVSGTFKGGKLMGSLTQTPDGQRVLLQFNLLNMPDWESGVKVQAVAMNPDTAHTALASDVDNHYLLRYGSLFGASFLEGYAQAIQTSGSQQSMGPDGQIITTYPTLSPKQQLMVGLGQVGTQLGRKMNSTFDRLPTVKVDAGVGIGLLFVADVKRAG